MRYARARKIVIILASLLAGQVSTWLFARHTEAIDMEQKAPTTADSKAEGKKKQIYEALKTAIESLQKDDKIREIINRDQYKLTATRGKDHWCFWFVFLPASPGNDVTVFVHDDGRVRLLPGL